MLWLGLTISMIFHLLVLLLIPVKINSRESKVLEKSVASNALEVKVNLDYLNKKEPKKEKKPLEEKPAKARVDYAYTETKKGGSGSSKEFEELSIDRLKKEGFIPELVLDFKDFGEYVNIARFFGYQLVAYNTNKREYICKVDIKDWSLVLLSKEFLEGFSKRGRTVMSDKLCKIASDVFLKYDVPVKDIVFYFLIPVTVEDRFIKKEIEAGEQAGVGIDEVEKAIGHYVKSGNGYTISINKLVLKDGRGIQL